MAKINELALEKDEIEEGKNRMKTLLRVYRSGKWHKSEMEGHFNEWKKLAVRIKTGARVMDEMKPVRETSVTYQKQLEDLYSYLMSMLGLYDLLFQYMFRGDPELYRRAQAAVLGELK